MQQPQQPVQPQQSVQPQQPQQWQQPQQAPQSQWQQSAQSQQQAGQPQQTGQFQQSQQSQQFQSFDQQDPYQVNQQFAYQQQPYAYAQPVAGGVYPMSETDKTLRLIAFILNLLSLIAVCWLIIPLAWMIPMCVRSWGIYKGTKPNTVAFGVCTLIFISLVGGILLLISKKDL